MSIRELLTFRNRFFAVGFSAAAGLFVASAVAGFVVFPYAQSLPLSGLWDAICSAAGLPRQAASVPVSKPARPLSEAVITPTTLSSPSKDSIGRGATLAQQCAICHGPVGITRADSPNLAGQYAVVIYKQLIDFRSGARVNAIMTPFAVNMTDQEMKDVAAYYAYLPRLPAYHPAPQAPKPKIVVYGAPIRGIAPCGSCHGSLDNKAGSPWLEGQPEAYIRSQLQAFAGSHRTNDISQQMRNIARAMTAQEIEEAAKYYASQPPEIMKATD